MFSWIRNNQINCHVVLKMNWLNLNYQEYTSLLHSREAFVFFVETFPLGIDYLTSAVTKPTLSKSTRKRNTNQILTLSNGTSNFRRPWYGSWHWNFCNKNPLYNISTSKLQLMYLEYKAEVCRKQPTFIVYVTEQTSRSLLKIHTTSTKTKRYTLFF